MRTHHGLSIFHFTFITRRNLLSKPIGHVCRVKLCVSWKPTDTGHIFKRQFFSSWWYFKLNIFGYFFNTPNKFSSVPYYLRGNLNKFFIHNFKQRLVWRGHFKQSIFAVNYLSQRTESWKIIWAQLAYKHIKISASAPWPLFDKT